MADEKKPLLDGIQIIPTNQEEFNDITQLTDPEKILSTENKVNKLFKTIPILKATPNYKPKDFHEQLAIYNGILYCYINGSWVALNTSTQYKVGYGTGPSSPGTQAITGIGFTPKMVIINANKSTDPDSFTISARSYGHASSTSDEYCTTEYWRAGAINLPIQAIAAHLVNLIGTDGVADCVADLNSLDSDGFTLNWTTATIACDYVYECYG